MKGEKKARKGKKSEFHTLRRKVGLERHEDAKKILDVSARTLQRWDKEGAPAWAMRILRYHDRSAIPHGPEWTGWTFSRGKLVNTRKRLKFTPENLSLWPEVCAKLSQHEGKPPPRCPLRPLWEPLARYFKTLRRHAKN